MTYFGYLIIFICWTTWSTYLFKFKSQSNGFNELLIISAGLIPFYSISLNLLGLQLSIYKLVPIIICFSYFKICDFKIPKGVFYLLLYLVVNSIIFYFLALSGNKFSYLIELGRNPKTAYINPFIQSLFYLSSIFQIWFISTKSKLDHIKILSTFSYSCLLLTVIGYLQILFYKFKIPWFKYWFLNDSFGRAADDLRNLASDNLMYRMSSLGGEPRHFPTLLVLGFFTILYLKSTKIKLNLISGNYGIYSLLLILSGIIFSYSSSGILTILVGSATYLFLKNKLKLFLVCIFLSLIFLYFSFDRFFEIFWKLSSIKYILYAAPKDFFIIRAMFDNFLNFIFGYGISMTELFKPELYLIQDTPFGIRNRLSELNSFPMSGIKIATSPILQTFSNGGFIGLLWIAVNLRNELKKYSNNIFKFVLVFLSLMISASSLSMSVGGFIIAIILSFERKKKLIYKAII